MSNPGWQECGLKRIVQFQPDVPKLLLDEFLFFSTLEAHSPHISVKIGCSPPKVNFPAVANSEKVADAVLQGDQM